MLVTVVYELQTAYRDGWSLLETGCMAVLAAKLSPASTRKVSKNFTSA